MKSFAPAVLALALSAGFATHAATPSDTLVIAQSINDASSFDPAAGFELTSVQAFTNLYQRLLQAEPQNPNELKPTLACRWEAGKDNRSLIVTLRDGATFASGNPLRPEDVIFSLARVVKLNLDPSFILTQLGWTKENVGSQIKKLTTGAFRLAGRLMSARPTC